MPDATGGPTCWRDLKTMATTDMSKPTEGVPSDLLPVIRKSGVLSERQFEEIRSKVLAGDYPFDPQELADRLVREKILTPYQVRRFLKNKPHGLTVSRYVILDRIGSGSMGRVYKAHHQLMDRVVALKIIAPEIVSNARVIARFQREMKLVGRLDHPNVVRAFDADQLGNIFYIVMEYVAGQSLGQRFRAGANAPVEGRALCLAGRARAGSRPCAGDRPPRREAVEPAAGRGRPGEGARPGPGGPDGGRRAIVVRHGRRDRRRHDRLHVAGAGPRQGSGRAERPVQPRLRDVPPDLRPLAVPGRLAGRAPGQADQRQADTDHRHQARPAETAGRGPVGSDGQQSAGPLPDGPRSGRGAPILEPPSHRHRRHATTTRAIAAIARACARAGGGPPASSSHTSPKRSPPFRPRPDPPRRRRS